MGPYWAIVNVGLSADLPVPTEVRIRLFAASMVAFCATAKKQMQRPSLLISE